MFIGLLCLITVVCETFIIWQSVYCMIQLVACQFGNLKVFFWYT